MNVKLETEGVMMNTLRGYGPQLTREMKQKEKIWSKLNEEFLGRREW